MNFQSLYLVVVVLFVTSMLHSPFSSNSTNTIALLPISDTAKLSATIDGNSINLVNDIEGIKMGSNSIKNIKKLPDSSKVVFQSYLYKTSGGEVIFELNIGTLKYSGMKPALPEFINFFKTGKLNYSLLAMDGVEIKYRDSLGILWSTSNGSQSESNFEFIEISNTSESIRFKAQFSCKLYNLNRESKTMGNGIFTGSFQNY